MKRILVCLVAFLLSGAIVQAQLPTGTILGVVKDPSGAVVPGAKVTARDVGTGLTRVVMTGTDGTYRLDAMPVATYQITAEATGFQTEVQNGLTLSVGEEAVTNFTLQVGEATQTVSITTSIPLVSTTTSSLSTLVNPERIADLPLNGRNYVTLTLLQPGVTESSTSNGTTFGWSGVQFSANGAPLRSNEYLLDGAILDNMLNTNGASVNGTTLGVDGIQEFQVITNNFSAEYGMGMGSQQVIVSKAGTNQFHGDAFEFLRNSSLDSRNEFDLAPSRLGRRLPPFRRNQFGGALGGPIKKDKTFFFGVYEGLRAVTGTTNTDSTLATGCQGGAGAVITLAECPQINTPSVTIAPQMAPIVALFPAPNLPNNEYGFVFDANEAEDYGQIRIDQMISSHDNLFARWTVDHGDIPRVGPFGYSYIYEASFNQFITLAENHIFSASLLNSARISYSRTPLTLTNPLINPLLGTAPYEITPGLPMGSLSAAGVSAMGTASLAPQQEEGYITTGSDDVDYNRGRHSLKFGVVFNHYQDHAEFAGFNKGNGQFPNIADFMEGGPLSNFTDNIPGGLASRAFVFDTMGFYAEDDWRLRPRLTLNLGMRYEPDTSVWGLHGLSNGLRNPATDTSFTPGPLMSNPSLRNWGPRFGFADDVFGDGKTSLRGGFAILYNLVPTLGDAIVTTTGNDPPYNYQYLVTPAGGQFSIPFPVPAPGYYPINANGLAYRQNQSHLLSYNLTGERQLPDAMAVTVSYAGSRGIDLMQQNEQNPVIPTGVPLALPGGTECVAAPAGATPNLFSQLDNSTATSCYLLTSPRTNPAFGSMALGFSSGDSIYNALQVGLNKHLTKGLQFQTAYTWSRLIDDGEGLGGGDGGGNTYVEPLHEASRRGPAEFDVTHVFHGNALYHFPDFVGNGFAGKLANGWWMSGIESIQSGNPLGTFVSSFRSQDYTNAISGSVPDDPDLVPGRNNVNTTHGVSTGCSTIAAGTPLHNQKLWYDPCAFSVPAAGFIGTEPRLFMRGPGYDDLDYSLVKDTAVGFLGEGGQIEFRSEFFNILNHPNFASPSTTVLGGTCPGGSLLACSANAAGVPSSAGVITATNGTSRQIQFAVKILF